jgi:hypothetical protein
MKIKDFLADYPYYPEIKQLYLKGFVIKDKTPTEFVENFLADEGYFYQYETHKPDGVKHCRRGANRSVEEIYIITKTYFPDLKIAQYIAIIANLLSDPANELMLGWCPDIEHHVIFKHETWQEYEDVENGIDLDQNEKNAARIALLEYLNS